MYYIPKINAKEQRPPPWELVVRALIGASTVIRQDTPRVNSQISSQTAW